MITLSELAKLNGFVSRSEAVMAIEPEFRAEALKCETFILDFADMDETIGNMKCGELDATWKDLEKLGRVRLPYHIIQIMTRMVNDEFPQGYVRTAFYHQMDDTNINISPVLYTAEGGKIVNVITWEEKERIKKGARDSDHPHLKRAAAQYAEAIDKVAGNYVFFMQVLMVMLNTVNIEHHDVSRNKSTISGVTSEKKRWGRGRYTYICPPDFGQGNGEHRKHDSPRPHLRRGHFKMVRCGAGRVDRRQVWIEPCFVMGTPDAPREAYVND